MIPCIYKIYDECRYCSEDNDCLKCIEGVLKKEEKCASDNSFSKINLDQFVNNTIVSENNPVYIWSNRGVNRFGFNPPQNQAQYNAMSSSALKSYNNMLTEWRDDSSKDGIERFPFFSVIPTDDNDKISKYLKDKIKSAIQTSDPNVQMFNSPSIFDDYVKSGKWNIMKAFLQNGPSQQDHSGQINKNTGPYLQSPNLNGPWVQCEEAGGSNTISRRSAYATNFNAFDSAIVTPGGWIKYEGENPWRAGATNDWIAKTSDCIYSSKKNTKNNCIPVLGDTDTSVPSNIAALRIFSKSTPSSSITNTINTVLNKNIPVKDYKDFETMIGLNNCDN